MENETQKPTTEEILFEINEMIKNIEKLPSHAMLEPATQYDILSLLFLLSSILKK